MASMMGGQMKSSMRLTRPMSAPGAPFSAARNALRSSSGIACTAAWRTSSWK